MLKSEMLAFVAAFGSLIGCGATEPATAPATLPAITATQPVPLVMDVLGDLEAAGTAYGTILADFVYAVENPTLGDSQQREGWVAFQAKTRESPAKFRAHFETRKQAEGPRIRARIDWAFDGEWLTEANHRTKQMTHYQIASGGRSVEPLRIGKGPFPIPFGQKRSDVLEHFEASARPADDGEPTGTVRLQLVTRRRFRQEMGVTQIDMWIDRTRNLPVRIVSHDLSKNVTTVDFRNVRTNETLKDDLFKMPRPLGWTVTRRPLEN